MRVPKISVIVPVYNAEKYIIECIESVISQSFTDWELLLINDGSTDNTSNIIDEYELKDSRVKSFHFENEGLSVARNRGIDRACGNFIIFLDADDTLLPDSINKLYNVAVESKSDIVAGKIFKGKVIPKISDSVYEWSTFTPEKAIEKVLYQSILLPSACGKLYCKKLFKELRFEPGILYEDLNIFYLLFDRCEKITFINTLVYFYRLNLKSLTNTWCKKRLDVLNVTERLENYIINNHPSLIAAAQDRRLSANFNMFCLASMNNEIETADQCWEIIKSYRQSSLFNPKVRLKNKLGIIVSFLGKRFVLALGSIIYRR